MLYVIIKFKKKKKSVDRGSIEVSIASIDRHSIAGVNSTHDPARL